ncbi:LysR family transcriptional regulator [Bordetella muralis]|uniref:LysR family transcriptional regulator n=1 Tax=Bordetella muralis TaxID=1649130 RepID=UPI0039EDF789
MEIYQIRAFVTVARLGNLTKAADALSLTQPAVTAQIKALEQSLGVALFERAAGRLTLAKAGEVLLPTAESLLVLGAQFKAEAQQLQGSLHGAVDLGVPSEQPDFLRLGELASAVREQLPLIELKTLTLPTSVLHEHISTGRLHAALTIAANPPRAVHWMPLRSVRYRIALPVSLANSLKRGGWREVAQLPWLDGPAGSHTHLLLRDMFERHGLAPRIVMQHDDQANLDALVRAGAGCALLREETALAGAAGGEFIVWGQARADATLGFMMPHERASEPVLVALISLMQKIWKSRRLPAEPEATAEQTTNRVTL